MADSSIDLYTIIGICGIAVGILIGEELASFILRRVARMAGAGQTVLRDIKAALRLVAVVLILSITVGYTGLSSFFTGLTVSAVLAVAVSLGLQATLSNVIAGLLLFSDGVLRLNDTIEVGNTKGQVVRVGLRNTWVKTEKGSVAVISNTSLSNGPLLNHTATERLSRKYRFA